MTNMNKLSLPVYCGHKYRTNLDRCKFMVSLITKIQLVQSSGHISRNSSKAVVDTTVTRLNMSSSVHLCHFEEILLKMGQTEILGNTFKHNTLMAIVAAEAQKFNFTQVFIYFKPNHHLSFYQGTFHTKT